AGMGSGRVRTVTLFWRVPDTPSGSDRVNRHSYSVPGSRSKRLPTKTLGHELAGALVVLAIQADQRLPVLPVVLAPLAVGDCHDGVAVVVALHVPLEAEGLQRRGLDYEAIRRDTVACRGRRLNARR